MTTVIPSSRMIRAMICASNCEPVSEIGETADVATAS